MRVLIFNAFHFLAKELIKELEKEENLELRKGILKEIPFKGEKKYEIIEGNILDSYSLDKMVQNCDVVINLAEIFRETRRLVFGQIHVIGTQNLIEACQRNKVKKIIFLSSLGADIESPVTFWRTKAQGEKLIEVSGLDYTIFRPGVIFGPNSYLINRLVKILKYSPLFPLVNKGRPLIPLISAADVVLAIKFAIYNSETSRRKYNLITHFLSFKDLINILKKKTKIKKSFVFLPSFFLKLIGHFTTLFHLPNFITYEELKMLTNFIEKKEDNFPFPLYSYRFEADTSYPLF